MAPRSRGELIARRLDVPEGTEESCELRTLQRRPPLGEAGPLSVGQASAAATASSVAVDGTAGPAGVRSHLALRSLVSEWPHPTRLETRTKECNMRASLWVANPAAQ